MGTKTKSKTTKKQTVSGHVDVRVEPLIVELKKRKCMISIQIYQEIADGILIMSLLFLIGIEFGSSVSMIFMHKVGWIYVMFMGIG